jgi:hypothetical protein
VTRFLSFFYKQGVNWLFRMVFAEWYFSAGANSLRKPSNIRMKYTTWFVKI